jgi:hypothetical protein
MEDRETKRRYEKKDRSFLVKGRDGFIIMIVYGFPVKN